MYIIMTKSQAESVTTDALQPVLTANGKYAVGTAVLLDETHSQQWETLKGFPTTQEVQWITLED